MSILDPADFVAVRAAIDIELDDVVMPDAVIALSIYQGQAENYYLGRIATAVPPVDTTSQASKDACTYYTAALLVPAYMALKMEKFADYSNAGDPIPWDVQAALLQARGDGIVDVILGLDPVTSDRATMFQTVPGYRMR